MPVPHSIGIQNKASAWRKSSCPRAGEGIELSIRFSVADKQHLTQSKATVITLSHKEWLGKSQEFAKLKSASSFPCHVPKGADACPCCHKRKEGTKLPLVITLLCCARALKKPCLAPRLFAARVCVLQPPGTPRVAPGEATSSLLTHIYPLGERKLKSFKKSEGLSLAE
jgi:hypothetical protein